MSESKLLIAGAIWIGSIMLVHLIFTIIRAKLLQKDSVGKTNTEKK